MSYWVCFPVKSFLFLRVVRNPVERLVCVCVCVSIRISFNHGEVSTWQIHSAQVLQTILQETGRKIQNHDKYLVHTLDAPWCWHMFLHSWAIFKVNLGKCSTILPRSCCSPNQLDKRCPASSLPEDGSRRREMCEHSGGDGSEVKGSGIVFRFDIPFILR